MSIPISKKYFLTTFFLLILVEIFSYLGWSYPVVNTICFCLIILATLILSWRKLEYGLYVLFAELFVGSFGYLFSLTINGFRVSVRMGIFVVVMLVWLKNVILEEAKHSEESRDKSDKTLNNIFLFLRGIPRPALVGLGMVTFALAWAFVWGLIRGNSLQNVFFDFNNWLYWLILLPLMYVISDCPPKFISGSQDTESAQSKEILNPEYSGQHDNKKDYFFKNILSILSAGVLVVGLKTIILFYLFTHGFAGIGSDIYRWVRDTRIGEITLMGNGFYRIFIQSQIYALLYFLILFCISCGVCHPELVLGSLYQESFQNKEMLKPVQHDNNKLFSLITYYLLLITSLVTIILSLSRSFWLGLFFSLLFYLFISLFIDKNIIAFFKKIAKIIAVLVVSLGLAISTLYWPPKISNLNWSSIFGKRVSSGEAASSSRMNQLKPLLLAIGEHPLIGSGFGTEVNYISFDPRAIQNSKDGSGFVKTYAFEWGYLDMILKFGLMGLGIYLYLIYLLINGLVNFKFLILNFKINQNFKKENYGLQITDYRLRFGFLLALLALLIINIFSPYLNHPLGIGFIILTFILCQIKK